MKTRKVIRAVAALEAFKGVIALVVASGLLTLVHHDARSFAISLIEHAHLDPAAHYPNIFIRAATHLQNVKLTMVALGAAAYACLRFVEAYGLMREAAWAEVLAALSGAIYIPFEIAELTNGLNWLGVGVLLLNIAIVWVMVYALQQKRRARSQKTAAAG